MSERKLSLFDACAMAIGGMVGGGIFAVLGEAVQTTGNAAFLSFGLAGLLALVTGISYSRLTLAYDEPGGSFSYIEHLVGPRTAGTVSWYLLLGYLFTISLYAFTFGAYASRLVGGQSHLARAILGAALVAILGLVNVAGVRASGLAEDILVYGKVTILVGLAVIGLRVVDPQEALPVMEGPPLSVLGGAALIFVAYEGFQLLTYDYNDLADHRRNLPRAIRISIPLVIVIYMAIAFVTTGTVSDDVVSSHSETILAYVAEPVVGRIGFVVVTVAAVLSTSSAVHATLFATARLAKRIAADGQLPADLTRWERGGVPVPFIAILAALAVAVQLTGNLHRIAGFSSLVFLLVFAGVNAAAVLHRRQSGGRGSPPSGWPAARAPPSRCWWISTPPATGRSRSSSPSPPLSPFCGSPT